MVPTSRRRFGVLSELQQRVALIFAGLSEAEPFVLAGGAALIVRGDVDRLTRDLDFFGLGPGDVDRVVPVFEAAVRAAGMTVERRQSAPGFARLVVSHAGEQTEVDVEPRFGLAHLCRLAAEKDLGFQPAMLRGMLERFEHRPRDEFDIDATGFDRLRTSVDRWRQVLDVLNSSVEKDPPDVGRDLGL